MLLESVRNQSLELVEDQPIQTFVAPAVILLNAAAGPFSDELSRVREAVRHCGIEAEVRPVKPADLTVVARQAIEGGARLIVAAGGDGTINAVANAVAGTEAVLGVLPTGTLNHFARDLGLPADLEQATLTLATGQVRFVDVGQVNGRIFLNNCSIGLYPSMVIRRDEQRQRLGRGKWLAMFMAFLSLFKRYPLVKVELDLGDRSARCATPLVFIGNNRYETNLLNLGRRHGLDGGELSVYLINAPTRLRLLRLVVRGLLGRLANDRDFELLFMKGLTVESRKRNLRVAMDGEVLRMRPPLVFQMRPRALRVLAP